MQSPLTACLALMLLAACEQEQPSNDRQQHHQQRLESQSAADIGKAQKIDLGPYFASEMGHLEALEKFDQALGPVVSIVSSPSSREARRAQKAAREAQSRLDAYLHSDENPNVAIAYPGQSQRALLERAALAAFDAADSQAEVAWQEADREFGKPPSDPNNVAAYAEAKLAAKRAWDVARQARRDAEKQIQVAKGTADPQTRP